MGAEYLRSREERWDGIGELTFEIDPHLPEVSAHPVKAQVYVKPEFGIKFYKVVGPSISYKDYFELLADYRYEELGVELAKGTAVDLNFNFEIVDPIKFTYSTTVYDQRHVMLARLAFAGNPSELGTWTCDPTGLGLGFYWWEDPVTVTGTAVDGCEVAGYTIKHLCRNKTASKKGAVLTDEPIDASKLIVVGYVPEGMGDHWSGEGSTSAEPTLTITTEVFPPEAGQIVLYPTMEKYPYGINVLAEARANENFAFHHWEEDATGDEVTAEVAVYQNRHVRAVFASVVPRELQAPSEYGTIQAALDAATYNDRLILGETTFSGEGNRELDFHDRNVSLVGSGIGKTVVDLSDPNGAEYKLARIDDIDGFGISEMTVLHAAGPSGLAALDLYDVDDFVLENCAFEGCTLPAFGTSNCTGIEIVGCRFAENGDAEFGVVQVHGCSISGCVFEDNGSLALRASGTAEAMCLIDGCEFAGNAGGEKAAAIDGDWCCITECEFAGNSSSVAVVDVVDSEIASSTFTDNAPGAVEGRGVMTISDSTFLRNEDTSRGGGAMDLADVEEATISGCEFEDNVTDAYGGAIYGRSMAILDSTFTGNHADQGGGAVYCQEDSSISDCVFTNNTAVESGGAIDAAGISVVRCQVTGNRVTGECEDTVWRRGGGASLLDAVVVHSTFDGNQIDEGDAGGLRASRTWISDCTITNNKVLADGRRGGGFLADMDCVVVGCTISGNELVCDAVDKNNSGGGGACIESGSILRDCVVESNVLTSGRGGGVLATFECVVEDCQVKSNQTDYNGGGVWAYDSDVLSSEILENAAGSEAGGVFIEGSWSSSSDPRRAMLTDCVVRDNDSARAGGVYAEFADLEGTTISGNEAEDYCGGIYGVATDIDNCAINLNVSPKGGGAYLTSLNEIASTIANSEVAGNRSSRGLLCGGGTTATNCDIHDNEPEDTSGCP